MNLGTFVVLLVVIAIVALAIRSMVIDKKNGRACTGCACHTSCHGSCGADKMVDDIMKSKKTH